MMTYRERMLSTLFPAWRESPDWPGNSVLSTLDLSCNQIVFFKTVKMDVVRAAITHYHFKKEVKHESDA